MRATLAGIVVAVLTMGTAGATTTVYYDAGSWHAFSGTDAKNQVVCGIGTENPTDGRRLDLSFVIGGDTLFFRATKPGWAIPDGTGVGVIMQVGLSQPWNKQATGSGTSLAWSMARSDISAFDQQFRGARSMTLSFPSGNEPPWSVSLTGSTAADNTFARCIADLTRRQQAQQPAAPTQPFGQGGAGGAPTQPFSERSGTATPTQPPAQPHSP